MKRNVRIVLSLIVVLSMLLAACGTGAGGGGGGTAPAPAAPAAQATPAPEAGVSPVSMEFFLIKVQALTVHEEMQRLFQEENPHVTINFVATPDAETAMFARIAAGDVPDIMNTFPTMLTYRIMMDDGLFVDLTGQPFFDRIPADIQELSLHNGRQFSIPIAMSSYGVYYNIDFFAEHGLEIPTTYPEFLALAETIRGLGVTPLALYGRAAGTIGQMVERFIGILENDSDSFFRNIAQGNEDIWARPEVRILGETLLDMRNISQADVMAFDQDQAIAEFITGRAAMIIGGTWFTATMMETAPDLNFSMFALSNPMGPFGLPISIDTAWSIYSGAACIDTALAKMEFLTRPEIAQMYADIEGSPNVVQGVQFNTTQLENINANINDPALNVFLTPVNFWPPGFRARWQEYGQLLLIDGDVDNFISNTYRVINEFYD